MNANLELRRKMIAPIVTNPLADVKFRFAKLSLIAFYRQLTHALRSHVIVLRCLDAVLIINFFALILVSCSLSYPQSLDPYLCIKDLYFR